MCTGQNVGLGSRTEFRILPPPFFSSHPWIRHARIMLFESGRISDGVFLCILTHACVCVCNFFLWAQYVCVCLYVSISFTLASRKGTASASAYPDSLLPPWCPPQPFVHTGHSESLWNNLQKHLSFCLCGLMISFLSLTPFMYWKHS